jgi:acylphosphatase
MREVQRRRVNGQQQGREQVAAELLIEGRVQGVGYREFARGCAERSGLVGYAMNLRDGRVRVVLEGEREVIDTVVLDLERGPRLARVTRVSVDWHAPSGLFTGFGIRVPGHDV